MCGIYSIKIRQKCKKKLSKKNRKKLEQKLRRPIGKAIKNYNMIKDGDRVLVALSGGKDSLTMLHILLIFQVKPKKKYFCFFFYACFLSFYKDFQC